MGCRVVGSVVVPAATIDARARRGRVFNVQVAGADFRVVPGQGCSVLPEGSGVSYSMPGRHDPATDQIEFRTVIGRHEYIAAQSGLAVDAVFEVREVDDCLVNEPIKKKDRKVLLLS